MTTLSILHIKIMYIAKIKCIVLQTSTILGWGWGFGLSIRVRLLRFSFTFYYLVVVWPYLNRPLADTESLYLGNPMCLFQVFRC